VTLWFPVSDLETLFTITEKFLLSAYISCDLRAFKRFSLNMHTMMLGYFQKTFKIILNLSIALNTVSYRLDSNMDLFERTV
jgi:hypothetical protein